MWDSKTQIKENTACPTDTFTKRQKFGTVRIVDKIYIIGGYSNTGSHLNDVWKSKDYGKTWIQKDNTAFKPREGMGVLNYNNELFLLGGRNTEILTDVWISEEKVKSWYRAQNSPFKFFEHEIVEAAGDLFVIEQDHVWKSIDKGNTWQKVLFEAPFEERTDMGIVNIWKKN